MNRRKGQQEAALLKYSFSQNIQSKMHQKGVDPIGEKTYFVLVRPSTSHPFPVAIFTCQTCKRSVALSGLNKLETGSCPSRALRERWCGMLKTGTRCMSTMVWLSHRSRPGNLCQHSSHCGMLWACSMQGISTGQYRGRSLEPKL